MASIVISDARTTTQTFGFDDDVLITPDGSVTVATSTGLATTGIDYSVNVTVYGDVMSRNTAISFSGTSTGSYDEFGTGDYFVYVGAGARVSSFNDFQDAIILFGSDNRVENDGTIYSPGFYGVNFRGTDAELVNRGVISGEEAGVNLDGQDGTGLFRVANSGDIVGDNGILNNSGADSLDLTNSGAITGTSGRGIYFFSAAVLSTDFVSIVNSGTISGTTGAIRVYYSNFDLDNTGALIGDLYSFSSVDNVTNSGRIVGDVELAAENDTFIGLGGTVTGLLDLGSGDDLAILDDPTAQVIGGDGDDTVETYADLFNVTEVEWITLRGQGALAVNDDDTATYIRGNVGNNIITGAGGNDTLRGGQGSDELLGGDDDDLLIGNSGDDELFGDNGLDTLFGGQGDDEIFGGFGNDELFGGAGDDTINPGGAQDTMAGGAGADVFLFESATDAGSGSSADRIDGFVRGVDVIDLVALGTTPASFIGTSGFSGGGNMEVRYTVNGFGNALVRIDENGDGTEDARVVVSQTAMLDAGDFLL